MPRSTMQVAIVARNVYFISRRIASDRLQACASCVLHNFGIVTNATMRKKGRITRMGNGNIGIREAQCVESVQTKDVNCATALWPMSSTSASNATTTKRRPTSLSPCGTID